jgi:hypothetical protein
LSALSALSPSSASTCFLQFRSCVFADLAHYTIWNVIMMELSILL